MKKNPVVMDDFLLVILTIPLIDRSLQIDLNKVYNLSALHQDIGVQFSCILECQYLEISKHELHTA